MSNLNLKHKIMIGIAIIGAILVFIFQHGIYSKPEQNLKSKQEVKSEEPQVVSTNPSPLENTTILPTQSVEITFNYPIQNIGEFKNKLEPKVDYKVELSDDRKTAKIIPVKAFGLGITYTLFILPDTKFDGKGSLNRDIIYHFQTVGYKGI